MGGAGEPHHRTFRDAERCCRHEGVATKLVGQESSHRGGQYQYMPGPADGAFQRPVSSALCEGDFPYFRCE